MVTKLNRADSDQLRITLERIILFVLGAGVGALVGFRFVVTAQRPVVFFGGIALAALAVGVVSAKYGRRFWEGFGRAG